MMEDARVHGFRWPLHPLQVVSWVVFGTDVVVYLVLCIPMIETLAAQVVVSVFFVLSVGSLVVSTFLATKCNPMDPYVLRDDSELKEEELDELPYCGLCNTTVQARSKHCRACNKCVASFDHHCMWLNNCIGGDNYRAFFVSISSVAVMIGIVVGTILYLIIDFATNEGFDLRLEASAIHTDLSREAFLGILIAMCCVNVPLWLLDMQLVVLHSYLMHQNLTTYEYITNKRQEDGSSRFRGLPRCMDWIVFSRCGRRKKKKDAIQKLEEGKKEESAPVPEPERTGMQPPEETAEEPRVLVPASVMEVRQAEAKASRAGLTGEPTDEADPTERCEVASSPTVGAVCGCDGSASSRTKMPMRMP